MENRKVREPFLKSIKITDLGPSELGGGDFRVTLAYTDEGRSRITYTGRGSFGLTTSTEAGLSLTLELHPVERTL